MKTEYVKPMIQKVDVGVMSKFGANTVSGPKIRNSLDGVGVDELSGRFGSPLFVYSEKTIRQKHREMHQAFTSRYPRVALAWSYKTNYLGAICAVMHQQGSLAEVVSEMEYEKARQLGVTGDQIVFNGPDKSFEILKTAAQEGARIHIDHLDEIEALEAVADALGCAVRVGLRINMNAGILPAWSRFGFNLESGQALEAVRRIFTSQQLKLKGLHCHIGTFILDPNAYGTQVEKLAGFANHIHNEFGLTLDYLDIGGGFPSRNRLKGMYESSAVEIQSVDVYAETICDALLKNLRPGHTPRLIVESGRALIDEAGALITRVAAEKRLADGTKAYVIDAGLNLLFTSNWYRFNIALDRKVQGFCEKSILYGPLCMNIDVIDEGLMLPPLRKGAHLIISPVGAYNNTQWMQFIHYRPAVVMISENGEVDVIREAEDLSDITRRERLPSRLKTPYLQEVSNENALYQMAV